MANPMIERREGAHASFEVSPGRHSIRLGNHPLRDWQFAGTADDIPSSGAVITGLADLEALLGKNGLDAIGVRLMPGEDVQALVPHLSRLAVIELAFPKYRDGRHYSSARILRDQLGYTGEIRAVGDVLVDQLFFMVRCGIDTLELHPDVKPESAQRALARFADVYQSARDTRKPVWALRG